MRVAPLSEWADELVSFVVNAVWYVLVVGVVTSLAAAVLVYITQPRFWLVAGAALVAMLMYWFVPAKYLKIKR